MGYKELTSDLNELIKEFVYLDGSITLHKDDGDNGMTPIEEDESLPEKITVHPNFCTDEEEDEEKLNKFIRFYGCEMDGMIIEVMRKHGYKPDPDKDSDEGSGGGLYYCGMYFVKI